MLPPPQAPGAQKTKSPAPATSALSPAERPPAPTFPIAERRAAERVPERRWRRAPRGLHAGRLARRALRTPTPSKLGSGGAGGGGAGQVAAARPGGAGAERGFGRSEPPPPPPRGGGAELKSRAERAGDAGGRALPGLRAPRPAGELLAGCVCGRLRGRAAPPTLPAGALPPPAARSSPPPARSRAPRRAPLSPRAPPAGAAGSELAEWSLRWGRFPVYCFRRSLRLSPPSPPRSFPL